MPRAIEVCLPGVVPVAGVVHTAEERSSVKEEEDGRGRRVMGKNPGMITMVITIRMIIIIIIVGARRGRPDRHRGSRTTYYFYLFRNLLL